LADTKTERSEKAAVVGSFHLVWSSVSRDQSEPVHSFLFVRCADIIISPALNQGAKAWNEDRT
jgi:hypothetical protein